MGQSSVKSRKLYQFADKMVALKSLALSLSNTSPELLTDKNGFLPDLSYTFSQYLIACF